MALDGGTQPADGDPADKESEDQIPAYCSPLLCYSAGAAHWPNPIGKLVMLCAWENLGAGARAGGEGWRADLERQRAGGRHAQDRNDPCLQVPRVNSRLQSQIPGPCSLSFLLTSPPQESRTGGKDGQVAESSSHLV